MKLVEMRLLYYEDKLKLYEKKNKIEKLLNKIDKEDIVKEIKELI